LETGKIAGAILSGGGARRMGGAAKGALEVTVGVTIIERLISELNSAGISEIIISANDPTPYADLGKEIVKDIRTGVGPLAGIEAVLAYYANRAAGVMVLPCDLPRITANEISALVSAFKPDDDSILFARTANGHNHQLCGVINMSVKERLSADIDTGERKVITEWRRLGARSVSFADESAFININTPTDLEQWRRDKRVNGKG